MYEGLQEGKILCAAALDDSTLLTAGESTVGSLPPSGACPLSPPQLFLNSPLSLFPSYPPSLFTTFTLNPLSQVVYVWSVKAGGPKDRSPKHLQLKHTLHGHTGSVTCLATSASYNLIISGSKVSHTHLHHHMLQSDWLSFCAVQDKTCILWDSNRLLFVRQLRGHNSPVTIVTINQLSVSCFWCRCHRVSVSAYCSAGEYCLLHSQ